MDSAAEATGILAIIIPLFLLIAGIMAVFIPFWVFRIRNEMIKNNKLLAQLVELNGGKVPKAIIPESSRAADDVKICPKCHRPNRKEDYTCVYCGTGL